MSRIGDGIVADLVYWEPHIHFAPVADFFEESGSFESRRGKSIPGMSPVRDQSSWSV